MKNELVHIRKDDVFTDSLVVSHYSGNEHESIRSLIRKHESSFGVFGKVAISNRTLETKGGVQDTTFYELNEPQATFLITLLRNTEAVVNFKIALIKEFYHMRKLLMEKQTADWQQARAIGKCTRKIETDIIRDKLIPLAIEQGSANYSKFYNDLLEIGKQRLKNQQRHA